jgi:hypothetical protein
MVRGCQHSTRISKQTKVYMCTGWALAEFDAPQLCCLLLVTCLTHSAGPAGLGCSSGCAEACMFDVYGVCCVGVRRAHEQISCSRILLPFARSVLRDCPCAPKQYQRVFDA